MLPVGTPSIVVERLQLETAKSLRVDSVRARLIEMGGEPQSSSPQDMTAMLSQEVAKWTRLVAEARIAKL